jgi:site-specific recombinase XerD
VLGEQLRVNQGTKAQTYAANIDTLNNAQLQNLQAYAVQQQKQETAKSLTKATTQAALDSVASKFAQNKAANRQLAVMENMYNYRFDKSGRAINMNPFAQFDVSGKNSPSQPSAPEGYEYETILKKKKSTSTKESRNGSIVKAIKNL